MKQTLVALPLVVLSSALTPAALVQAETPVLLAQRTDMLQAASPNSETVYLPKDTVQDFILRVETPTTLSGLAIPQGAIVQGRFEPAEGGLRYRAYSVQFNNRTHEIRAASDVFYDVKDPRETSPSAVLGDAAAGAAGGALLAEIFGDASIGATIGGAAVGVLIGNVTAQRVVVIEPNQPIVLTPRLI